MAEARPNPSKRSWFAVWRWKWWVWCFVVTLASITYLLSPTPVILAIDTLEFDSNSYATAREIVDVIFKPAFWCSENSQIVSSIWSWQYECWFWMQGNPLPTGPIERNTTIYPPAELAYPIDDVPTSDDSESAPSANF